MKNLCFHLLDRLKASRRRSGRGGRSGLPRAAESVEQRLVMSAQPLPVLMVIADQRDFYYQEYGDTRDSLEAAGVDVVVAASSTDPSTPHAGTGQGASSGIVVPDIALPDVDASDYSAIVFVGGWGSSMYQYAFPGDYQDDHYDGSAAVQQIANSLINDFVAADKHVAAICHGVTILAWARVDGASPLNGRQVASPFIGSPGVQYNGIDYAPFALGQLEQIADNGGIAGPVSGFYGDPATAEDDVVVDGRIITAENYDSAAMFGAVIAAEVIAAAQPPAGNLPPVLNDQGFVIPENSIAGTVVVDLAAIDPDPGQVLTYSLGGGNLNGAFSIDASTGVITVANPAALDFETNAQFQLIVNVTDNGVPSLSDATVITIDLLDVAEPLAAGVHTVAGNLVIQGTAEADTIYVWSGGQANQVGVWMNGVAWGMFDLSASASLTVYGEAGNDRIYATDLRRSIIMDGGAGHDLMTGGTAADRIFGGPGIDRIHGMAGDDLILGGADSDQLFGHAGNDLIVGGDGQDTIDGGVGRDVLIGGSGGDRIHGGAGDDLLIGGSTAFDDNSQALSELQALAAAPTGVAERRAVLAAGTVSGARLVEGLTVLNDSSADLICGGSGADLVFASLLDDVFSDTDDLFVIVS